MTRSICSLLILSAFCALVVSGCGDVQQVAAQKPQTAQTPLLADCIALYYKVGDSAYVTRQQHQFTPRAGGLRVIAEEPTGRLEYSLYQETFSASGRQLPTSTDLPESFFSPALATTVFYGMCAGGSLLDTEAMTSEEPVKIEGLWYQPFIPDWPQNKMTIKLFKNQDTNRFDLVSVSEESGAEWLARIYNFRYNSELQTQLPQTVDVFDVGEGIASKRLAVRFEYKNIRLEKNPEAASP